MNTKDISQLVRKGTVRRRNAINQAIIHDPDESREMEFLRTILLSESADIIEFSKEQDIPENAADKIQAAHFSFRPSDQDIIALIRHYPNMKRIFVSPTYLKNFGLTKMELLKMRNIKVEQAYFWGWRTDYLKVFDAEVYIEEEEEEEDPIWTALNARDTGKPVYNEEEEEDPQ